MLSKNKLLRQVQTIRFIMPVVLFSIVASYETWEHILIQGRFYFDPHFSMEIAFFGIIGPSAVYLVLTYISSLLKKQIEFSDDLEKLNQELEKKVKERTEKLEEQNETLAKTNKELQQLDQLKSDFVSLVSHELRGPLTTLNGGIELALQEGEKMPPEARRVLEIMSSESQRLTDFVQTILDVSRLDAGKLNLNLGPVAIVPLLRRIIDLVFAGKEREVIFDETINLPPAWADEIYLEKILCNLLTNADKYAPKNSPVKIDIEKHNGNLAVSVIDYGPGVPKEAQSIIFERFSRLERGDCISTKGWGLGLYFAKALAEAQGCMLTLKSPIQKDEKEPGTAFIVTIPVTDEVPGDE